MKGRNPDPYKGFSWAEPGGFAKTFDQAGGYHNRVALAKAG